MITDVGKRLGGPADVPFRLQDTLVEAAGRCESSHVRVSGPKIPSIMPTDTLTDVLLRVGVILHPRFRPAEEAPQWIVRQTVIIDHRVLDSLALQNVQRGTIAQRLGGNAPI